MTFFESSCHAYWAASSRMYCRPLPKELSLETSFQTLYSMARDCIFDNVRCAAGETLANLGLANVEMLTPSECEG